MIRYEIQNKVYYSTQSKKSLKEVSDKISKDFKKDIIEKTIYLYKIKISDVDSDYIFYNGLFRDLFFDLVTI